MKFYAVIDGSNAPGLLAHLQNYPKEYSCLYNEPIQEDLREFSPYLIELSLKHNDYFKQWLNSLGHSSYWGICFFSKAEFLELRRHLRKYTYAKIPNQDKPVMFRYYDPRVFWRIVEVLDNYQLNQLLGPIDSVVSFLDGKLKEDDFIERRNNIDLSYQRTSSLLTFSEQQYKYLNGYYQEEYEVQLGDYISTRLPKGYFNDINNNEIKVHQQMLEYEQERGVEITHPLDQELLLYQNVAMSQDSLKQKVYQLAKDINQFCIDNGILDDRSIKGIALLFIRDDIREFKHIKPQWYSALLKNEDDGLYRAKMLLLKEFGTLKNI